MARQQFIAVAADDWYQRRRGDDEGRFFRAVASQGPRKGEGGSTRQGIYCLTADGTLLSYKNAGQNAQATLDSLEQGLRRWRSLPAAKRRPGAVKVPPLAREDKAYSRKPPETAQVARVFARNLERSGMNWERAACAKGHGDEPGRDHLWLLAAEIRSLSSPDAKVGDRLALPKSLADRIARFHLVDNTRGEPPFWTADHIRTLDLAATLEAADQRTLRWKLEGMVLASTGADPASAERGYDATLLGTIVVDRLRNRLMRFDVLALGDHWGEGTFTRGARPGRTPLGIAFELALEKDARQIAPQGARELDAYLGSRLLAR